MSKPTVARILATGLFAFFFLVSYLNVYSEGSVLKNSCATSGSDLSLTQMAQTVFESLKFSGAFLVSQKGQIIAEGYCGTPDPKYTHPVVEETRFNIGSVSKQFTGYLLLELLQEHMISLDTEISKYVPELRDHLAGKITIEQLMKMRGGIRYVPPLTSFIRTQLSSRIRSEQEMVETIKGLDLDFLPGEKFSYSNLGYSLLGVIIGRIERLSWAESIQRRIFEPFGMRHSSTEGDNPKPPENLAAGLLPFDILSNRFFLRLPHWNYSMIKGAGGIVTTVRDLHLWNIGLSKKVKANSQWSNLYFPSGQPGDENYSYGWFLSESAVGDKKIVTINHGGEDPGYCATAIRIPSLDAHLVVTLNSDYCALNDGAIRPFTKMILKYLANQEK